MTRSPCTLLIVEDFAPDRELYRRALLSDTGFCYQLLEAESVAAGLELCQTQVVDAILLDYSLPDADGLTFLEALHHQSDGDSPPVVMVTGEGDESIAVRAIKLGVEDYLTKRSLTPQQLRLTMQTAIENARLRLQLQQREENLRDAIGRERIVHHITLQIRQSLNLTEVLNTTVHEVRQFLSVDRAFIYRFDSDFSGRVVVESVGAGWVSALDAEVEDTYFTQTHGEAYRQGRIQVVEDIQTADLSDCHREMLRRFDIRANLVVPILQGESLWGLLVLNQCDRSRQWQPLDIDLLGQLAAQIGIAIYQAELYQQMQTELLERQKTEARLQESQRFVEQVAQAAPGILYLYDLLEQRAIYTNRQVTELLGYTPEEIETMGENLLPMLFHPEDFARVPEHQARFHTAPVGATFEFEYRMQHASGEWRWFYTQEIVYSRTPAGAPHQILGISQDISDRKRNQQHLRDSEERLQLGVQVAGVALAHFDYASAQVRLSPEAAALYGFSLDELVITREQIHNTFHPEERADLEQIIAQVLDPAGAGWFDREHRIVWRSGEVRWLRVRKQVFFDWSSPAARPNYAILAAIDITDRKQAEAERERLLAEAEAANQSKDEFVAIVAHELRAPLNSIQGWAKLLQSRKVDAGTLSKALDTIVRNTEAQVQLVEDLLDISRLVRGTLTLNLTPVNLATVVEAALDMVRPQAQAKGIAIVPELMLSAQISGDSNRLQQLVLNLLTNAVKFTPEGGRVEVRLESVEAQIDQIQLCVRDTGKGIAPEFLPRIFERFQQGQKNTGSKDGLGLGLAIVKNLVELHEGTIRAESPGINQGSTFTVQFPRLSTAVSISVTDQPQALSIPIDPSSLAGTRILIVDDDADQLNLITFVLEEYAAEVRSATTAIAAIDCLLSFKPDLLISDLAMPSKNGYDLLQQIRSLPDGAIPAIVLTAYASTTAQERSLQAGFQRHLTKPVEPEELVTAILSLVKGTKS